MCLSYAHIRVYEAGDCYREFPRMRLVGNSVNKASSSLVQLQDRFWAMSCSAAYEVAQQSHKVFRQCS
jgi:hypothetical protein